MGEVAASTESALTEIRSAVDLMHGRVASMDTTQQSLVAQLDLISAAVQDGAKMHADAARHLAALDHRLAATAQAMERMQALYPEEDDPDPEDGVVGGRGSLTTARASWTGNHPGASSAHHGEASAAAAHGGDKSGGGVPGGAGGGVHGGAGDGVLGSAGGGALGGAGGGVLGGAGGGVQGGAGGGRHGYNPDSSTKHNLKMSFPRFDGENPRVWKDKCLDYFRLFNVNPSLWLVSSTLHMDGNAALWLKAYKLRHEIASWPALMTAVIEKFGADDYRKYLKQLMALKQKDSVEEY
jgi:hypothetical protein